MANLLYRSVTVNGRPSMIGIRPVVIGYELGPVPPNTFRVRTNDGNPPSIHTSTFTDCGRDTVTGAAELAQIPSDWK